MRFVLLILLFPLANCVYSQNKQEIDFSITEGELDSIDNYILSEYEVSTDNQAFLKNYRKTKYFVRRVYDYSKIASNMLLAFEDTLEYMDSKRMKKRYINRANKILKQEFGDEIRNMSITRGEYLMKLIYRQTGYTTYDIIKYYRGGSKAFWYQALCKINGQDLKRKYNPKGEDYLIERVVLEIEAGKLSYINRPTKTQAGKKAKKRKSKKGKRKGNK